MDRPISRRQFCQGSAVAVGAGISGLAAAWFYRQQRPAALRRFAVGERLG